jgi:hypothetical protein
MEGTIMGDSACSEILCFLCLLGKGYLSTRISTNHEIHFLGLVTISKCDEYVTIKASIGRLMPAQEFPKELKRSLI